MYRINYKICFLTGSVGLLFVLLTTVPSFAQEDRDNSSAMDMEITQEMQIETEQSPPITYSSYYSFKNYMRANKYLPFLAVKTNLLYAIGALTPNLGMELGIGARTTLQLSGSYNPWNRIGTPENNDKLVHWMVRPEFRYWFCERFNGHFIGLNALYNQFNISGKNIPLIDFRKDFRYEGFAVGTGIDYGYHLLLGGRWALEFSIGLGIIYMKYDLFECLLCSALLEEKTKTWFGPTHLSIGLEFMIR